MQFLDVYGVKQNKGIIKMKQFGIVLENEDLKKYTNDIKYVYNLNLQIYKNKSGTSNIVVNTTNIEKKSVDDFKNTSTYHKLFSLLLTNLSSLK